MARKKEPQKKYRKKVIGKSNGKKYQVLCMYGVPAVANFEIKKVSSFLRSHIMSDTNHERYKFDGDWQFMFNTGVGCIFDIVVNLNYYLPTR